MCERIPLPGSNLRGEDRFDFARVSQSQPGKSADPFEPTYHDGTQLSPDFVA
jgi:hypothetical protein